MASMSKPEGYPSWGGNGGTQGVAEKAKQTAGNVAHAAREQVMTKATEEKQRAASGLGGVAQALRSTGQSADNDYLQEYASRAADGIEQVTDYFRDKSVGEIVDDVERFARREPALFLGGAFALGLLGARFLKSSSRGRAEELEEAELRRPLARAMSTPRPAEPAGLITPPVKTSPITPIGAPSGGTSSSAATPAASATGSAGVGLGSGAGSSGGVGPDIASPGGTKTTGSSGQGGSGMGSS